VVQFITKVVFQVGLLNQGLGTGCLLVLTRSLLTAGNPGLLALLLGGACWMGVTVGVILHLTWNFGRPHSSLGELNALEDFEFRINLEFNLLQRVHLENSPQIN
jgi:hypothetical protein